MAKTITPTTVTLLDTFITAKSIVYFQNIINTGTLLQKIDKILKKKWTNKKMAQQLLHGVLKNTLRQTCHHFLKNNGLNQKTVLFDSDDFFKHIHDHFMKQLGRYDSEDKEFLFTEIIGSFKNTLVQNPKSFVKNQHVKISFPSSEKVQFTFPKNH